MPAHNLGLPVAIQVSNCRSSIERHEHRCAEVWPPGEQGTIFVITIDVAFGARDKEPHPATAPEVSASELICSPVGNSHVYQGVPFHGIDDNEGDSSDVGQPCIARCSGQH